MMCSMKPDVAQNCHHDQSFIDHLSLIEYNTTSPCVLAILGLNNG